MPFVKLDCSILDSSIWSEKAQRDIFITALLMATPREITKPTPELKLDSLDETGWKLPAGWYGYLKAASKGIMHRAMVPKSHGIEALSALAQPEADSKSKKCGGRRMVRIDGGFIIINFMEYREKDQTSAERQKKYRARLKEQAGLRKREARARQKANGATVRPEHVEAAESEETCPMCHDAGTINEPSGASVACPTCNSRQ